MNYWVLGAGVISLLTAFVHIFAGQVDPVRPFLKSELADVPKATLLSCWHMVSVVLLCSSLLYLYAGWRPAPSFDILSMFMSFGYLAFTAVFVVVGWYFFGVKSLLKLPQWVLLLPVGVMGCLGTFLGS
ncbi:hypothetical protein CS022_13445 [Veronia nyctiphanis]|uniref:DUF423 domain-containing protein n=1 Tax=Veronia nyctiphanis TaxID=1278244 RepID=A0A4Q0YPG0_9GAMM|nr:hypothetical protein [Veronia nyctiphanis]RXJ72852.1 hypothetical protein CS022_13445 [Veronia nyctiphanis]